MSAPGLAITFALRVTAAWQGGPPLGEAIRRAHRGVDEVFGADKFLDFIEPVDRTALFITLPRPGHPSLVARDLPGAGVTQLGDAGEGVFTLAGRVGIPEVSTFGSALEPGLRVDWHSYAGAPVALTRLEALHTRELRRELASAMAAATDALASLGAMPWRPADRPRPQPLDLPPGIGPTTVAVLELAANAAEAARVGLTDLAATWVSTAGDTMARELALRELLVRAESVLEGAANCAVLELAGRRPAT